ncbi:MAG: methyl-accepting chemotaxis protein [Burkholderiaceae bacterium]
MNKLNLKTKLVALSLLYFLPLAVLMQQRFDQMNSRELAGGVFFTLLLLYFLSGFYRSLIGAVENVKNSAAVMASGNLSHSIHIAGTDELAKTGENLETMSEKLSLLVANIRSNSVMVSEAGKNLSNSLADLSARTEQQASSLEQTNASVAELTDTVNKNAVSAKSVDTLAANVRKIAESGGAAMQSAVDSMQGIQASATKMGDIVNAIDAIAFQTNILALNAAVEAARAGEQGRGFAVVATEVRNLAQRSASSAKEIKTLIENSVEEVRSGVRQIGLVSSTLNEIVSGIRELASNVSAISSATVEQSHGLGQISEALHHLDELTQSNSHMAETALDTAAGLDLCAGTLAKSVALFKLRRGSTDDAYLMTKKGLALCQAKGGDALLEITEDKDHVFADRDMYVFVFDKQGTYRAFGGNKSKLGVSLLSIPGLDGRKVVNDAFAVAAKGGGWINYTIVNPVTNNVEAKTSYIEKVSDQLVIGCGVYK